MSEAPKKDRNFSLNILGKAAVVGALLLLMLLPLFFIQNTMKERKQYKDHALGTISSSWGSDQLLAAPFINIGYTVNTVETVNKEKVVKTSTQYKKFAPQNLETSVEMIPQVRNIGIFSMPVYTANIKIKGNFDVLPTTSSNAFLTIELKDLKGITKMPQGKFGTQQLEFEPYAQNNTISFGALGPNEDDPMDKKSSRKYYYDDYDYGNKNTSANAIAAKVKYGTTKTDFEISFPLQGSGTMNLVPIAKQNKFTVSSPWKDPLFFGSFLPAQKEINENGFSASWDISYLASGIPQTFDTMNVKESVFGVKLATPVDSYRNGLRAAKYGLLFLALTFLACFVFEIVGSKPIHAFQYVMVGAAMSIFYILLLSLSEFMCFGLAYLIAAAAVIVMITSYIRFAIIKESGAKYIVAPAGILTGLYIYLYVLLQLQDFSLLFGAFGLFIGLAAVMYTTRNINWYE
ncbi:inner membrane protein [Elusimicrobium posterum]|uniref:cell envelope integrity protein CreD n=1 Tax=Elusimicrobium posterum TaxID=3116653 RepID=UPI003C743EDB